jgi:pimeloyl-ACP methyl ester carboxylesterase
MAEPPVRYAKTVDRVNIAYQVRGDGPADLVYTLGMAGNFEIEFEPPWGVRFLDRLASFSRVILFNKRGTGLSDRVLGAPDFDMRADDLRAVLDAAGSERAVLVGNRGGGSLAAFYAAAHPDRVLALVLYNSWARTAWASDYPVGSSKHELAAWRAEIEAHCGTEEMARRFLENVAPSHANDPSWVRWEARALRQGARVAGQARPSEVLVSQTVKDLVTGSGLTFEDAGEHELKGVPDRWHLYRVVV